MHCCTSTQIFGLNDRDEIEEGVRNYALGFVGLAIFAGVSYFIAVSVETHLN